MSKRSVIGVLMVAAVLCAPLQALAQDTVESIQKDVLAKWDKVSSLTAGITGTGDIKLSPESPTALHLVASGSLDSLKKDGKTFSRIELGAGLTPQAKPMARILAGSDGTAAYVETEFLGKVESKTVDQLPIAADAKSLFDLMNQHLNLAVMPSEKVDDKEAYVIAGEMKKPEKDIPVSKIIAYFDKETGIILKVVALNMESQPMVTLALRDIVLNAPIPEEKFRYTPPAPPAPKPEAAPATPAAETAKPEPAPAEQKK